MFMQRIRQIKDKELRDWGGKLGGIMATKIEVIANTLYYIQKARVSAQVRKTHLAKQDKKCDVTEDVLLRCKQMEDWLDGNIKEYVRNHPAYDWFNQIKGIGDINIGKVVSMIDIEKASQVSKLWRYAGFGVVKNEAESRKKGEKLHYNKTLKSMCWRLGKSLIRAKGKYYDYYIAEKKRIAEREKVKGKTIVPSNKLPKENGKRIENDEFFGLGHVDMMAMRKMIKLFLSHLWLKWREAENLPITEPYAFGVMNHSNKIEPDEMIND